ncbi:Heterodisulfide reductase, subunit C [Corchorus olitorius]|uniref:Heterodisulfide reductase, subunit C n=1 Tax=Corchorus olitorius TaxID=93759 RepID=A0A1R3GPS8_9ROSI|nr:Heterodisulfide reductase, subunit C [Corchorus olitorius]
MSVPQRDPILSVFTNPHDCVLCMLTCWTGNNGAFGIVNLKLGVYENLVAAGTASKFDICGSSILHPTWLGSILTSIPACFNVVLPFDGETLMCTKSNLATRKEGKQEQGTWYFKKCKTFPYTCHLVPKKELPM